MLAKSMSTLLLVAICTLGLGLLPPAATPAAAAPEDVALFQEELARFGQWLTYGNHGQVWRPTQVDRQWRPYTNGRWAPTQEGYVFETDEPWGWATYHYGNWLPTNEHGWVWIPGRTWYPHTVNWRTSDENVGWSPVPPPDYMGAGGYGSNAYNGYGTTGSYGSSRSLMNYLSPNYWMFTRASDFLLGYGQPYSSAYSYANAGLLAAPQYVPTILQRTVYVTNYVYPSYAPKACYNWGPPVTYITKVTNIKNVDIDYHLKGVRLANLRNVMPPASVVHRHPAWREIMPASDDMRYRHIRSAADVRPGPGSLNRPDAIPAPPALVRRPAEGPGPKIQPGPLPAQPPVSQAAAPGSPTPPVDRQPRPRPPEARPGTLPRDRLPERPPSSVAVTAPGSPGPASNTPQPPSVRPASGTSNTVVPQPPVARTQPEFPRQRSYQRPEGQPPQVGQPGQPPVTVVPPDRQQAEQQWRARHQRQEMEQRQRQIMQDQHRQQIRQQQEAQMENQRRQAEMRRQQQVEQMQRQQQMQQQRQAEIQRLQQMQQQRQADIRRQQQAQMVRPAPPPPPQPAQPPPAQKKRDRQPPPQ